MKARDVLFAAVMLALSVAFLVVLFLFAYTDVATRRPEYDLAAFFVLGSLLVLTTSLGVAALLKLRREAETGLSKTLESYRHLWRLGGVLVVGIGAAVIFKFLLVPDSYGAYGYYRGDALAEQRDVRPPLYQGKAACEDCHDTILAAHEKDVHRTIQCETCHGPGARHIAVQSGEAEAKAGEKTILMPREQETCLSCHRRMAARPSSFPQIDLEQHYAVREVGDKTTSCSACHNPHEPLFLDVELSKARRHPMIAQCESCHRAPVDTAAERPETHPALFTCDYCHPTLAADYADRAHGSLGCRTCHQFYVESETAGRIVKHRDPLFCLLCHQKRPFVACDEKPCIEWPAHRDEVSQGPEDKEKVCADCHREAFHLAFKASDRTPKEEKQP